jgi:hypothetical protein
MQRFRGLFAEQSRLFWQRILPVWGKYLLIFYNKDTAENMIRQTKVISAL